MKQLDIWLFLASLIWFGGIILIWPDEVTMVKKGRRENIRTQSRVSRLARLHGLILRGNLILGVVFRSALQAFGWLWLTANWSYKAIVQIGTLAGILYRQHTGNNIFQERFAFRAPVAAAL